LVRIPLAILLCAAPLLAQSDEFRVYTDAPRLLLTPQRLRLLQREHQRDSLRWNIVDALISGGAVLPEPGFAWALCTGLPGTVLGQKAVDWPLGRAPPT
jgi:hypothetical protein